MIPNLENSNSPLIIANSDLNTLYEIHNDYTLYEKWNLGMKYDIREKKIYTIYTIFVANVYHYVS